MRYITTAVLIASLTVQSSAFAVEAGLAQLNVAKGNVLVNKGNGYKAVTGTTSLSAGDRVIVTEGEARFTSTSGCSMNLSSQAMLTVAKDMKCVAPNQTTEVVAADLPARVAPPPPVLAPAPAPVVGIGPAGIIVGVAAVGLLAAGAAGVAGVFDDEDDDVNFPVSP